MVNIAPSYVSNGHGGFVFSHLHSAFPHSPLWHRMESFIQGEGFSTGAILVLLGATESRAKEHSLINQLKSLMLENI